MPSAGPANLATSKWHYLMSFTKSEWSFKHIYPRILPRYFLFDVRKFPLCANMAEPLFRQQISPDRYVICKTGKPLIGHSIYDPLHRSTQRLLITINTMGIFLFKLADEYKGGNINAHYF